jgi:hypothetical protein
MASYKLQTAELVDLSEAICSIFLKLHVKKPAAEGACLLAYCRVAEGIQAYPEATRVQRTWIVVSRGAAALTQAIADVAAMSDADVAKASPVQPKA